MAIKRTGTNTPAPPEPARVKAAAAGRAGSQTPFVTAMMTAWGIPELRKRITFVFAMFGIYVVGLHIPIPGIDHEALNGLFSSRGGGGILSLIDVFSGGALKGFTVFAMGIIPYINASIIMQLLSFAYEPWRELQKEGESGRRKLAKITRYMTLVLSGAQAIGMTWMLHGQGVLMSSFGTFGNILMAAEIVVTLAAGTFFLVWLGEQITEKGIGNGISLIIFCGIMVRLPSQLVGVGQSVASGTVSILQLLILIAAFFLAVAGVIYVTLGQRKIPVQHVRKTVGNRMTQGGTAYLPFRVASAGVIPIIFALSVQLLPLTFLQFVPQTTKLGQILVWLKDIMTPGKLTVGGFVAGIVYAIIIVFFTYFYTAVTMNVEQIADDLKKYGSYIPGIRPGKQTLEYLDHVLTRITLAGALFLAAVALMQYYIPAITNTQGANGFTLVGGTSLLIVVGVALETMQAIEAQLLMRNYEGFIK
jgi:preprotein translocase subunit SecY